MQKLCPKRFGPFEIMEQLSSVTYRLDLPPSWQIHNAFHAALLLPYHETSERGAKYSTPGPEYIDGEPEWEVAEVMASRRTGRQNKLQYLIRWVRYPESRNSWEPAENLRAPTLIRQFHNEHPESIRGVKLRRTRLSAATKRGGSLPSYPRKTILPHLKSQVSQDTTYYPDLKETVSSPVHHPHGHRAIRNEGRHPTSSNERTTNSRRHLPRTRFALTPIVSQPKQGSQKPRVLRTLSLPGQRVIRGPPGSVEGGKASVLGAALHTAAALYRALTSAKARTIACRTNSGQKGTPASTIKALKRSSKIPHSISPPNLLGGVETTRKRGPKEHDAAPPSSASRSTPNLLGRYEDCRMACRTNSERGELAKLSSLKKRFPHQSLLWTSRKSATKTSERSSEASHRILPSSGLDKVWTTRRRWPKRCDAAPSLPVSRFTRDSPDQYEGCRKPSVNYRRSSVTRQGGSSSNSKPQNDERKSLTLGRVFMWPLRNLPDRENSA